MDWIILHQRFYSNNADNVKNKKAGRYAWYCIFFVFICLSQYISSQNFSNELYFKKLVNIGDSLLSYNKFNEARDYYNQADNVFPLNAYKHNYLSYKIGYSYVNEDEDFLALAYFTDVLLSFNPQTRHDSAFTLLVSAENDLLTIEVLSPEYNFNNLINKYLMWQNEYSSWENARFEYLIGQIYFKRLDYNNAIRNFKKSLAFLNNDLWLKEQSWYFIGVSYIDLLDYQNAADIFLYLQDINIAHLRTHDVDYMLGKTYMFNKNYPKAINCFFKALKFTKPSDFENSDVETYILIGNCYLEQDETSRAKSMYDKAEHISQNREFPSKEHILPLIAKGYYYGHIGDFNKQKNYLQKALKYLQNGDDDIELKGTITKYLTEAYYKNKEYEEAIRQVDLFTSKYRSLTIMEIINSIGWTSYQSLLQYRALAAYHIWQSDSGSVEKLARAYNYFKEGLNAVSSGFFSIESEQSKRLELKRIRDLYSDTFLAGYDLYRLTSNPKLLDELYLLVENSKANLFKINFHNSKALQFSNIPLKYIKLAGVLKKQVAWLRYNLDEKDNKNEVVRNIPKLRKDLAQAQMRYDSLISVIEYKYPQYYFARYNKEKYYINQIQRKLTGDQVILDYYLVNNRLFVFLISHRKIDFKEINIENEFEKQILSYRKQLEHPSFDANIKLASEDFGRLSYYFYSRLIKPYENELKTKRLLIIPDRELNLIPFQTLVTDTSNINRSEFSTLHYLVYSNPVTTLYSIDQLFSDKKCLTKKSRYLGLAPKYNEGNSDSLATLPGAKKELRKIGGYFKGVSYFGKDATKKNFLKNCSDFDIIHLALHTEINEIDPLYSKMFFSTKITGEPNPMFAYEIYEYPMHAKLLVLSGCNTGYGKLEFGEGIMNLARTFFYNGVENIIVTQWEVADKSSASLMDYFYNNISKGLPSDIALQQAKKRFLKYEDPLRSHPYYWAGYISVGVPAVYKTTPHLCVILLFAILVIAGGGLLFFIRKKKSKIFS